MSSGGVACVSVDLDTLIHYARIHGLPESMIDDAARRSVYATALPRLLDLFESVGVRSTLFVIGEDVSEPEASHVLRRAHQTGVELANHSHRHHYTLSRASVEEIDDELRLAEDAIASVSGQRPVGFRAPGYSLSPELYRAVARRNYLYDSSVFPAAPYYVTKAAMMTGLRLLGRPSAAMLDRPAVLFSPRVPYRPDPEEPYERGVGTVLELPISVTPLLRFPFFGTLLTGFPRALTRPLFASLMGSPFINLELHAIDVLDGSDGIPRALLERQARASVPSSTKLARLKAALLELSPRYEFLTLASAAERWAH